MHDCYLLMDLVQLYMLVFETLTKYDSGNVNLVRANRETSYNHFQKRYDSVPVSPSYTARMVHH